MPESLSKKVDKLKLQQNALEAYSPDYKENHIDQHGVEENGDLDGDEVALFIWQLVGREAVNPQAASKALWAVAAGLHRVIHLLDNQ